MMIPVAWGVAFFVLGAGLSRFFSPAEFNLTPKASVASVAASPSHVSSLFGAHAFSPTQIKADDIRVLGVIARHSRATVLVSFSNGATRALTVGVIEKDGWTLEAVQTDAIILSHYGAEFVLPNTNFKAGLQAAPLQ